MSHPARDAPVASAAVPDEIDPLFSLVYDELRRAAHHQLRRERHEHTLCTTALVHEAYLRLANQGTFACQGRAHFLALAGRAMRRVLMDHARRHLAAKRGGRPRQVSLDDVVLSVDEQAETLVALDIALGRLGALDERMSRVVECRFFAGMNDEETAEALGVTPRTVWRDWVKARGWLYQQLHE
jgi:RNA polymerase sigma factor (TIGR02999 family)